MSKPDIGSAAEFACKQRKCSLGKELGSGSFKRVFLIEDGNGRRFALKVASITPSLKPRFEREAAALAGCSHVGIAVLHESAGCVINGHDYWISVEEFLEGGTLAERMAAGPLKGDAVRSTGLALLDALEHLRARNLVHRDIKPANIMFRGGDQVVLTDFGIVRMLEEPTLTKDFAPVGPATYLYAAAEQLRNEKALIDWRTDQFCLALVLAECLLGHVAFSPEKDAPLAIARVARREPLPKIVGDHLDLAGFSSLRKALEPWPAQRYRTPDEMRNSLQKG